MTLSNGRSDLHKYLVHADDLIAGVSAGQVGVWVWNVSSHSVRWSPNLEEIHDLAPGVFDGTFSCFESNIHADDRANVIAAIRRAQSEGGEYCVRYRIPHADDKAEKWIEARGRPLYEAGVPTQMLGICQDVSEEVRLERELLLRARQQQVVAEMGWEALTATDLEAFLNKAALSIRDELGVELVKVLELVPGDKELLLRAGVGWKPGLIGTLRLPTDRGSQAGYALSVEGPVVVDDLRVETRFTGPQLLLDHGVVSGVSAIITGRDRRAYGVLGAHTTKRRHFTDRDVAFIEAIANIIAGAIQQRLTEARQNVLIRELRHHSGNLFAQLLALFSQTAKSSRNVAELSGKYEARVLAYANAYKLVAEGGWTSTSFVHLLTTLLAPFIERVDLDGPDVFVEPELAFGLTSAIHEMAANALKYGSLSVPAGRVDISWSIDREKLGAVLILDWVEADGPPVRAPRRLGFGSRLIATVIERQLNGKVQQSFDRDGLRARIEVTLHYIRGDNDAERGSPSTVAEPS